MTFWIQEAHHLYNLHNNFEIQRIHRCLTGVLIAQITFIDNEAVRTNVQRQQNTVVHSKNGYGHKTPILSELFMALNEKNSPECPRHK